MVERFAEKSVKAQTLRAQGNYFDAGRVWGPEALAATGAAAALSSRFRWSVGENASGGVDLRLADRDIVSELENSMSRGGHAATAESKITARIAQLEREGHGIQRHGPLVTQQQLIERVVEGKDPMTGSAIDGVHGGTHQYARHATKVNTEAAYVYAEERIRNSQDFFAETGASTTGAAQVQILLRDVFGDEFRDYVSGVTRYGQKNAPSGYGNTIFSDQANIVGRYRKNSAGEWKFVTMFPDP